MNNENNRVGSFSKVSFDQYHKDIKCIADYLCLTYGNINIPVRATAQSAGYDFSAPFSFALKPGESIKIPTGIRCHMEDPSYFLALFPRSSVGIKQNVRLMNTVGIIDADYYYATNEGHIIVALKNTNKKSIFPWVNKKNTWIVHSGDRICQGVFMKYGITADDDVTVERKGGVGSTGQ